MMAASLKVTLRKSPIGEKPKTRSTVEGLGLRKLHQTAELPDNPSVRGMLHKVRHLVEVHEVEKAESRRGGKKRAADE
jgi:large subunit ribosomal protein L30